MELHPFIQKRVLPRYPDLEGATIEPLGSGLINQTYLVTSRARQFVLQRLSAIFSPVINENIAAVTRALAAGSVILWVAVRDSGHEATTTMDTLRAHGAANVHVFERKGRQR